MRFLGFIVLIIVVAGSFGCGQNAANKKTSDANGASPVSSIKNRNSSYDAGKLVYDRNCKVCHQVNRMGMPKVYPPLKNTERTNGDKDFLIEVVLNGLSGEVVVEGVKYNGVMASYRNLTDQQIADVLNYIRSDGEAADDLVTADEVQQKR